MNTITAYTEWPKHIGLLLVVGLLVSCATPESKTSEPTPPPAAKKPQPVKPPPKGSPELANSRIYLGTDGKLAGRGMPDQPVSKVFRIGRGVHPKALSLPGLPKDKFGLIDWANMINKNLIQPAGSLDPNKKDPPPLDIDVVIHTKGDFVNNVMFRHKPHVFWLDCQNCHEGIFKMARGQNKMSMQEIVKGKWCGRCHGKVSFPLTDCTRCHSVPKKQGK